MNSINKTTSDISVLALAVQNTYSVYSITNTLTGRTYYGQTKNVKTRFDSHFGYLNDYQRHYNRALQLDWIALGVQGFEFSVIKNGLSYDESRSLEKSLMNSDDDCYNERCGMGKSKMIKKCFYGSTHYLDSIQVNEILNLKGKEFGYQIAQNYGVSPSTISKVMNGTYDPLNRIGT